ncbi:hypothetical protein PTSG_00398 [Salpingoeca rosetta]|uniref:MYCBP-associated protein n=1 Tax=Salpingoeca rosetta (strain ATCC 50818 / BSB-021) TaxID=946362 RepID=F2TWD2_SALR5|nr:uncharacterized protein PTSG_00398 [Salpingoeca rosetta]EGD72378.1 hypothetical protein PTSG_00398 [Salpingoeca rosetta]|eukprot:XP_004998947.1 hypothetical protein PTSG_00398 [Salpingoeca rosetta]
MAGQGTVGTATTTKMNAASAAMAAAMAASDIGGARSEQQQQQQQVDPTRALLRRNKRGPLVHHSFLGSTGELEREHSKNAGYNMEAAVAMSSTPQPPQPPSQSAPRVSRAGRFQRKAARSAKEEEFFASYQEERVKDRDARSLQHWNKTVQMWEKQERHISRRTGVPAEQLNMQSHELFHQKRQIRHAIEEAMPATEQGKGFRVGSEFWQPNPVTKSNLHYTLTKTEQGQRPEVEFVGRPRHVQAEMKVGPATYRNRDEQPGAYLTTRMQQLNPYLDDLAKHIPDTSALEVVGRPVVVHDEAELDADARAKHEQQRLSFVSQGARLGDGGMLAGVMEAEEEEEDTFNYDEDEDNDDVEGSKGQPLIAFEILDADSSTPELDAPSNLSSIKPLDPHEGCRVLFKTVPGQRAGQIVRLKNTGPTAIYFRWQRVERDNALGRREDEAKRFFLDIEPDTILPGAHRDMHLRFQSASSGVFSEDWQLIMTPCAVDVFPTLSLCGVTESTDNFERDALPFKRECEQRQVETMIRRLLSHIITNLAPRPRPPTPEEHWRTDAQTFVRLNPDVCTLDTYREDVVQDLVAFHQRIASQGGAGEDEGAKAAAQKKNRRKSEFVPAVQETPPWSYRVADLEQLCMAQDDDTQREELLRELQSICSRFLPRNRDLHAALRLDRRAVGKQILRRVACDVVGSREQLMQEMGMKQTTPEPAEPEQALPARKKDARSARSSSKLTKSRAASARGGRSSTAVISPPVPEIDPEKRKAFSEQLFIQVRRAMLQRVDEMVDMIADLPPCNPFSTDGDEE